MTERGFGLWSQLCGQFVRFGVVGVFSVLFNVVAYAVLVYLGVHYLVASGVGWAGGVVGSYILNRTYTFRSTGARASEFARYWIVYVTQLVISWTGLILLIDWVGLGPFVAYAINVAVVTAVSFVGLRRFVFTPSDLHRVPHHDAPGNKATAGARMKEKIVSMRLPFPHDREYEMAGPLEDESVIHMVCANNGLYEPDIVTLMACVLPADSVCLDIGANIGAITISMAAMCPAGTIHAIEPVPQNFHYLQRNVASNDLKNVVLFNGGIYSKSKVLRFHYVEEFAAGAFHSTTGVSDSREQIVEVRCVRVDDFAETSKLRRLDLIKIDVEGAEEDVLVGAAATLREFRPNLIIECNPQASEKFYGRSIQRIFDIVLAQGYVVSLIGRRGGGLVPVRSYSRLLALLEEQGGIGDVFCFHR